ncbi:GNAT family N-acetyltransferase [Chitinimonas sp. BJB300]|uniref:GNAT family N-acetyltransferase n=1 Tax=Chitinimonas sp. BJB300 TaxID=1559339 RepID=UPI000C0CD115|nr:GNAT family N-acetyltransferase [Chitinimonas sp. BJB300]PHV13352.1 GNAT family N-acetyltransferase [Chitinimonas sp. BJB300]TSJ85268.1 GNAT family N-acetyltransferase [Chitinimonas sp. BJB300]
MIWQIYPVEQFQTLAGEWDALLHASADIPFLESAFLLPLLKEFGNHLEVVAVGRENGQAQAAAILQPGKLGLWETFQPSQLPLGAWVVKASQTLGDTTSSLIPALPGLSLGIGLSQLDPLLQQRPEASQLIRTQDYIDTAWIDIESDFDTYWEARGKNLKQNARKQRNKLQTDGIHVQMDCIRDPQGVADAMRDYGTLESAGWKAANGTAVHPDNAQGRFYRQMLENFCALGRGRIYRYRFDDKVVSMDLCIDNGKTVVILKTAYDESYKSISPSTLMRQDQFQALFTEGQFKRIEFYGKVMEWHTRWAEAKRVIYHATAYRWSFLMALHNRINRMRQEREAAKVKEEKPEVVTE